MCRNFSKRSVRRVSASWRVWQPLLTAFFLYIAGAITEPPKTILFSGLDPRDAAAVTAKLDCMNVKYDAKGDGGTILVPPTR